MYEEQTLRGFAFAGIVISNQSSTQRWWADNREARLEVLAIKLSPFIIYEVEIGKPPRRMLNGPK